MAELALSHRHAWFPRLRRIPRAVRVILIVLASLLVLAVVIRLVLDPIATHQTRKALNQIEGMRGDFERVHVTIFAPGYEITHVKLFEVPKSAGAAKDDDAAQKAELAEKLEDKEPLFYAERLHVGLSWRQLLRARLEASLRLDHPKIVIVADKSKAPDKGAKKPPDISEQLGKVTALKVHRIAVFDGEVLFRDGPAKLWIHDLELLAQNLATRPDLAKGRPSTISAHGTVGRSGELDLFVSADPFDKPLSFAGQASLKGLHASETYKFVEPKAKLHAPEGTIDVFAEFVAKDGAITGGVKPVLKNIEIRPSEPGLVNKSKAWLADKAVEIASDRVPGRNAVATTIPIKGKLTDPDVQLWPTVLGVIRNAFVQGLASGFANVPPKTADRKEGPLTQAKDALKKDAGPPKAQPVKQ